MTAYAVGGRLKHFWRKWAEMGASRRVVRWLKFGMPLRFSRKVVRERGLLLLTRMSPPPPPPLNCMLSRLNQAERVATNGRSTNSQTVYSRNVSRRVRFLLESVPSPQEVRGLETSNRPVKVKRVLNTSNFPDGHATEGKVSRREGYVRYVPRSVRCIPSYSDAKGLSRIPVLSSQRQKVHVSSASLRLNDCAMGVHTSSEASEDLVIASSSGTVPICGRLAQSLQVTSASKDVDGSLSETL